MFRLKTELFWVLNEMGIEVFYQNKQLNRLIVTDKDEQVFEFLEFLVTPRTINEIKKYPNLTIIEKDHILTHLINNNYITNSESTNSRTEAFLNTYPQVNNDNILNKISNCNILIIGVGTATSYLIEILYKIGIKNITVIDGDIVEQKNLQAQIYNKDDIGKFKVEVLKKKYNDIISIVDFVYSYDQLCEMVTINKFNYVVNGADQITIMRSLLEAKKKNMLRCPLIESGYGVLQQNTSIIHSKQKAEDTLRQLNIITNSGYRWIISNSGSIFNSIFSAFSIAKLIFDDIGEISYSTSGFADFLQNRYFIGSDLDREYFEMFSEELHENQVYTSELNTSKGWLYNITKSNIFSLKLSEQDREQLSLTDIERHFLFSSLPYEKMKNIELSLEHIVINDDVLNNIKYQSVVDNLIIYVEEMFESNISKRIKNVLNKNIIDTLFKNTKQQLKTIKIRNNWWIINTSYKNNIEKILNIVHECFHIVYWDVTQDPYLHEKFVMNNELAFYAELSKENDQYKELLKKYLVIRSQQFLSNSTVLAYEKAVVTNNLNRFQIEFNDLVKNRLNLLVELLSKKINCSIPFYLLKYYNAYSDNIYKFKQLIEEEGNL